MTFTKHPTKSLGATSVQDGHPIVCKDFPYEGKEQLKWVYQENDSPVFRKINGKIQVVSPSGDNSNTASPKETVVNFPTLNKSWLEAHAEESELEDQYTALAVEKVKSRNPDLSVNSGTFGMIVSATATRLIALRTCKTTKK